jgi:FkbM family methyltransferase
MLILDDELTRMMEEYGIALKGVLHIGAHKCEEMPIYEKLGLSATDVVWIDAMDTYVFLAKKWGIPHIYNAVITDKDDEVVSFNVSNNDASSSILELETHLIEHPHIYYVDKVEMNTITVDTFFKRNTLDAKKYNMWNIDIQGAELLALKGGVESLADVDLLYLEVNERELYKGCALVGEIDTFLEGHGFKRIRTEMTEYGWGDAVYIKSGISKD